MRAITPDVSDFVKIGLVSRQLLYQWKTPLLCSECSVGRASFLIVSFKPRAIIPLLAISSGVILNAIIAKENALQLFQQSDLESRVMRAIMACLLQNTLNLNVIGRQDRQDKKTQGKAMQGQTRQDSTREGKKR
jgi:hypothetical protein